MEFEIQRNKNTQKKKLYLGIDGKYLNSEDEIFVIGEVKDKEFLGVTEDNSAACLEKALKEAFLSKEKEVLVVNMDMSNLIRGVTQKVFPEAAIVIDKFHVIKYVNRVIDLCRIAVEKSVNDKFEIKRLLLMKTETFHKIRHKEKWSYKVRKFERILKEYPEVKLLWDLKNKIHGFYGCKSKRSAKKSWKTLLKFLKENRKVHPELTDLKKTLLNWEKEILNYFTYHTTNAFIEGLNNRIETLKRKKFGFRSKEKFLKALLYMLLPITDFIINPIFTHLHG